MKHFLDETELIYILDIRNKGSVRSENDYLSLLSIRNAIQLFERFHCDYGINLCLVLKDPGILDDDYVKIQNRPTRTIKRYKTENLHKAISKLNNHQNKEFGAIMKAGELLIKALEMTTNVEVVIDTGYKEKIDTFLDNYLTEFENDNLFIPQRNIFKASKHFKAFKWLIEDLINKFGTKNLFVSQDLLGYHVSNDYRLLEFFLLMEKKGFIQIKEVIRNPKKQILKWDLEIDVLRDHNEAQALYFDWVSFGDLHFRPESGHAKRGTYSHHFNKTTFAYKLLNQFIIGLNGRFHVKTLCVDVLNESENLELKIYRQKIHDAVHKIIRPKLGLDQADSRVDIFANDDHYILTAKP